MSTFLEVFAIGGAVGVVLFLLLGRLIGDSWWDAIGPAFTGLFIGLLIGAFVGGLMIDNEGLVLPTREYVAHRVQLVSLHDADGIDGHWWLFGGRLDTQTNLKYYIQTPDGYQLQVMDEANDNVFIKTDAPEGTGWLEIVHNTFVNPSDFDRAHLHMYTKYIFHIPPDSISPTFKIGN